jgi:predicted nucleic acid-binding protein
MGKIAHDQFLTGKLPAEKTVREWISAGLTSGIAADACSLLQLYPLRAADALQLAAALEACVHQAQGYVFITSDQRLADAARGSGFSVEFI